MLTATRTAGLVRPCRGCAYLHARRFYPADQNEESLRVAQVRLQRRYRLTSQPMQQRIVGFHQDQQQHWVADLACGHTQHVRHDPPWQQRPWVLNEAERNARIGTTLNCVLCDHAASSAAKLSQGTDSSSNPPAHLSPLAASAYLDARMQGLCHEGALEIAEGIEAQQTAKASAAGDAG